MIRADIRHGTRAAYVNHGCYCPKCEAANTAYQQAWRRRARRRGWMPPNHGVTRYNFGCRCEVCRAAKSAAHHHERGTA